MVTKNQKQNKQNTEDQMTQNKTNHKPSDKTKQTNKKQAKPLQATVKIEVSYDIIDMISRMFQNKNKITVNGFRQGKIPTAIVYNNYEDYINQHAISAKLQDLCTKENKKLTDFSYKILADKPDSCFYAAEVDYTYTLIKKPDTAQNKPKQTSKTKNTSSKTNKDTGSIHKPKQTN